MADQPEMFDMSKILQGFDPAKFAEQFFRIMKDHRVPGVDLDMVAESQRKNVEALSLANRMILEGVQAIARRQAEIMLATMSETAKAAEQVAAADSPADAAVKQTELTRQAFERALDAMREVAEITGKANEGAAEAIRGRFLQSLEEIRGRSLEMQWKMSGGEPPGDPVIPPKLPRKP